MNDSFHVAAVIPVRDGLPYVLEAVESALHQTLPPAEIVVVDDASRDGTGEALERRFGSRVRLLRGRFDSAAAARNAGWRASASPWIAFLDADDLWLAEKLATAADYLSATPGAAWFFSDGTFRPLAGELQTSWFEDHAELREPYLGHPTAQLIEVNFVLTSSVVVRRDALERTGGFDERMTHAEDLDLWIRLSRSWPAAASHRALVRYQHLEGGLTRQVESRLTGDVVLFRRLAADTVLPRRLRRRARHREAVAHYKLAIMALREARPADVRRHLGRAWLFPERTIAVAAAWTACHLPPGLIRWLRSQRWATRGVAALIAHPRRVLLSEGPASPSVATHRKRT